MGEMMMMRIAVTAATAAILLVAAHSAARAQNPLSFQQPSLCVVQNGEIKNVQATYNTRTGDTTVNGRSPREAFPDGPEYAGGANWYVNNEPVTADRRRLVKYGLPRVLGATEVVKVGTYLGVPLFAEPSAPRPLTVVYAPVTPFCEFQPYQAEINVGPVRGL